MEYILILVTQLCILGLNTILPSDLTHNRLNQSTPRQTLRITMYQIYKWFCQHNVHFNTLSHLQCNDDYLVPTQHAIITLTYVQVVRTHYHLSYIISACLTDSTICCQTRHTNTTIKPTKWWTVPFQKIHPQYHIALQTIKYIQFWLYCHLAVSPLCRKHQIQCTIITI